MQLGQGRTSRGAPAVPVVRRLPARPSPGRAAGGQRRVVQRAAAFPLQVLVEQREHAPNTSPRPPRAASICMQVGPENSVLTNRRSLQRKLRVPPAQRYAVSEPARRAGGRSCWAATHLLPTHEAQQQQAQHRALVEPHGRFRLKT